MKKIIRFIVISFAPTAIVIVYSLFQSLADNYASRYYESTPLMITIIVGYLLIGIALLFICKKALEQKEVTRIPLAFFIGMLLLVVTNLYYFVPEIPFPQIFALVPGIGMPITGLFIGVYSMLFVILLHRRRKALKAQKTEPQA